MADDADLLISAGFSDAKLAAEVNKVVGKFAEAGKKAQDAFNKTAADGVENSTASMGNRMLDTMRSAISQVGEAIDADMTLNPTVTPVLDLTQFKKNASSMGGMLDTSRINPNLSYTQASSIDKDKKTYEDTNSPSNSTEGKKVEVNYVQNINSPKPVDPIEVYRNTKNLVSSVKGVVDSADAYDRV